MNNVLLRLFISNLPPELQSIIFTKTVSKYYHRILVEGERNFGHDWFLYQNKHILSNRFMYTNRLKIQTDDLERDGTIFISFFREVITNPYDDPFEFYAKFNILDLNSQILYEIFNKIYYVVFDCNCIKNKEEYLIITCEHCRKNNLFGIYSFGTISNLSSLLICDSCGHYSDYNIDIKYLENYDKILNKQENEYFLQDRTFWPNKCDCR
jgi:hypothetical protein